MLSQETFFYWIILSLGIHIAALSFCPLPATWTASGPGSITVDLLYGFDGGSKKQPGEGAGSDEPSSQTIAPPIAHNQPPAPVIPAKIKAPTVPPSAIKPEGKTAPKPSPQVPVEKPIPEDKPKPAAPSGVPTEEITNMPSSPTPGMATDAINNGQNGQATASEGSSIEGVPSYGNGSATTNAVGSGHGLPGSGSRYGGGDGIIRATPLGYGDNPAMPYPRSARRRGWEGEVLLKVEVSAHGRVRAVHIEKSSGYGILDDTALQAVSAWRFRPARINGLARPDTVIVPVHFRLDTP